MHRRVLVRNRPRLVAALAAGLLAAIYPLPLPADPVPDSAAVEMVRGWFAESPTRLEERFQDRIVDVEPYHDRTGEVAYYVVSTEPEGFVVVSADDLVEPILAFSDHGRYDPDGCNPLYALVTHDAAERLNVARNVAFLMRRTGTPAGPAVRAMTAAGHRFQEKWARLRARREGPVPAGPATDPADGGGSEVARSASISDVKVTPLLSSQWSQGTALGQYCYNYYTPNHYVCGCVATAMAQLMRYHEYPTSGIGEVTRTVYVNGSPTSRSTRGGDGSGGAYDWSKMTLAPGSSSYVAENWQMIGSLCHDAGVGVSMMYTSSSSGAYMSYVAPALKDIFQYSAATTYSAWSSPLMQSPAVFCRMLNSNLEADYPVLLGISGSGGGHAVVCDGYGYDGTTLYHHINMGWGGSNDAWYNLPNVDDSYYGFTSITTITQNVFPDKTGRIISGRTLSSTSMPLSGVLVSAQAEGGGPTYTDTSNAKGYYGVVVPDNDTYDLTASKDNYQPGTLSSIAVPHEYPDGWSGNYYGAHITLSSWPALTLTGFALQTSVVLRWTDPQLSGMPGQTVYIRRSTTDYPANASDGTEVYTGTDLTFEDTGLSSDQAYYYRIWLNDGSPYAEPPDGSVKQVSATPDPGKLKILWRNTSNNNVSCWILDEGGALKSYSLTYKDPLASVMRIAGAGDIDQDGVSDLILQNSTNGKVTYWMLASDGTLASYGNVYDDPIGAVWKVEGVGDINRDGTADLILRHTLTGKVLYWLLNSDGSLDTYGFVYNAGISLVLAIAAVADMNGDGTVDILWRNTASGKLAFWLLASDGTLDTYGNVYDDPIGAAVDIAGVGDINRDGTLDLLMRNSVTGKVIYWLLKNDCTLDSYGLVHESGISTVLSIAAVGDIDDDGTVDLIWRNTSNGKVAYWLLNSDGSLGSYGNVYPDNVSLSLEVQDLGY